MKKTIFLAALTLMAGWANVVSAQSEVMAWGNITGLRVEGEVMEFETNLRVVDASGERFEATGKERQRLPRYTREGDRQTVATEIGAMGFTQVITDTAEGTIAVELTASASEKVRTGGVFFCVDLPAALMGDRVVPIGEVGVSSLAEYPRLRGRNIKISGTGRNLTLDLAQTATVFVSRDPSGAATLWVELIPAGTASKGRTFHKNLTLTASGDIDRGQVSVRVDARNPGRLFDGLGGNFRLQNPLSDPKVIDYCLDNLRVAWGRVEMPWRSWHPDENSDPLASAREGKADARVVAAMEMARRLKAVGMPVIVSAWFPPMWAIEGDPAGYNSRPGVRAWRLDPQKSEQIYRSLADYLVYLKEAFGVEADFYSFNESDIGIDVLHTPVQHATFIKEMGAHLASRGLATKLLLGDNSDATTFDFIVPAMNDPACRPYIGAVSFHSWRGCDDATLKRWGDAARTLNVPLLVGEGSTDAAAWRYPAIFVEETFALYEINLYVRICALAQPLSILQWQLTADYSLMTGDGIYRTDGPLRPTRRFWNLKQLASTPAGSFSLPVESSGERVNCAAFGNIARGEYTVHLVNNGAARTALIEGLPAEAGIVDVRVTDRERNMEHSADAARNPDGGLVVSLPAASFVTVTVVRAAQ